MDPLVEPIRITIGVFTLATVVAFFGALRGTGGGRSVLLRVVPVWLALATVGATVLSHVLRGVPLPALVPAGAGVGLLLGVAALFSPAITERFAALEDHKWRLLTLLRAVFGALLLAGGAAGLLPVSFALSAGLGDLVSALLAVVAPGSLAVDGPRAQRLLVFGVGMLDFAAVLLGIVTVIVPFFIAHPQNPGISLLLPWVAVPLLATLNLFGLRFALAAPSHARTATA
jgi:hypothetical protein